MAEANEVDRQGKFPEKGKVESVCKQWRVHEDGVMAYELQNEEMDLHYGLNRYNRRTVREDIPVAKLVQSEEELRQQRDRMEHLMLLKTQAEEDEKIAKSVMRNLDSEEAVSKLQTQLHDEDYARKMQEKEKRRHERWKREQALKKERERLELELARHSEEARLVINRDVGENVREGGHVRQSSGDIDNVRVTSGGRIEDDGDFSDFYIPPAEHMEEGEKRQLQELQDEELARLLQEQEHKRTKAEVDRDKLKQIEQQDGQLARIIHEQDKLKAKKLKQRKQKSLDDARRQRNHVDAQRSQSIDDRSVGGANVEVDSPRSYHSNDSQSSHQQLRNHNSVSSNEDMLEQRLSPASPHSRGRSPPPYDHRPRSEQDRELPVRNSQSSLLQRDAREVEQWLGRTQTPDGVPSRGRVQLPPSPPGSSHSEDSFQEYQRSQQTHPKSQREPSPVPFNIAMAIDPTYRPTGNNSRPTQRQTQNQQYVQPQQIDPGLYEDEAEEDYEEDDPNWAPVQGQRRSQNDRSKITSKKPAGKRSSCKQQ